MPDTAAADILDACNRYVALTKSVRVDFHTAKGPWERKAVWRIGGYTQPDEICQAVERVSTTPGRYRVSFRFRNGTTRILIITREEVMAAV